MEPLENRISRLTPEQQQEVGDFVDFLLLKNNLRQAAVPPQPPSPLSAPPVMVPDTPTPLSATPAEALTPHIGSPQPDPHEPALSQGEPPCPIYEITSGEEDRISRDYMDYGSFDDTPSPATEAVKKVKQKIIARQEKDSSAGHILDWVD